MTQPTLTDLHPNEYSQGFYYYLFAVILAKFSGICNTFLMTCLIKYVFQIKQKI